MAEEKRSFVLYADLIHTVKKMPKEKAGELLIAILSYVNDENPVVDDMMVDLVFEPIKRQMKRDLVKYEEKRKYWSDAGKASAEAKRKVKEAEEKLLSELNKEATESTSVETVAKCSTESTVNVNVNDTVNVTVTDIVNVNDTIFKKKKREKKTFLPPSLFEFENYFVENDFSKELAQRVFKSYDVAEWIDARGNPVLNWKQKCQTVWFKEENKEKSSAKKEIFTTSKNLD